MHLCKLLESKQKYSGETAVFFDVGEVGVKVGTLDFETVDALL